MKSKIKIIIILIAIIVFLGSLYVYKSNESSEYNFNMYIFEAGKADCILISYNNKYILIDTGEESLANDILQYFNNHNITKLDYLIITHFDKDHVGSASKIIDNIEITNVLQSNCPKDSEYYTNYINSLETKGITPQTISEDTSFVLDKLNITVNGPTEVYESNESNNSSLIVSITYGKTSYLFMGDSQNDRIKDFLSTHSEEYDFIKIPYHGNYQKKLDDLLEVTKPKNAVITCSNTEPDTTETEELLKSLNIDYYLTKNGAITIKSDGENIKIDQ